VVHNGCRGYLAEVSDFIYVDKHSHSSTAIGSKFLGIWPSANRGVLGGTQEVSRNWLVDRKEKKTVPLTEQKKPDNSKIIMVHSHLMLSHC
jgi:hypothetical protein